jgi:hypothetical protein
MSEIGAPETSLGQGFQGRAVAQRIEERRPFAQQSPASTLVLRS